MTEEPLLATVLIVDDVPDNVAMLHDALDAAGHTVLVALNGESALRRARQARPDVVLLDALMPEMDGFEVARLLKADPLTADIPILFMTGLTDTEHLEAALAAGGVDYVTKPVKPREVMARMGVHIRTARKVRQADEEADEHHRACNALDAFGYATITVRLRDGRLLWETPLARSLLLRYFGTRSPETPPPVLAWLSRILPLHAQGTGPATEPPRLTLEQGPRRLTFRLHQQVGDDEDDPNGTSGGDWLIVMQESNDASLAEALAQTFGLTAREAEVLYWVTRGKINRDIADILGASPATVKKHLERILPKLGVETRTAAAALALAKVSQLRL